MLHANFPQRIRTHPRRIQCIRPPRTRPVQELETTTQKPAQKEPKLRQERPREDGGEEADAAPGGPEGARYRGCSPKNAGGEFVEEFEG